MLENLLHSFLPFTSLTYLIYDLPYLAWRLRRQCEYFLYLLRYAFKSLENVCFVAPYMPFLKHLDEKSIGICFYLSHLFFDL